jgi:hypothetical protein
MQKKLPSSCRRLVQDERGIANVVDFVLVMPFFVFMICAFVQLAMIIHTSLILHYSAYAAARTVRTEACSSSLQDLPFISTGLKHPGLGACSLKMLARPESLKNKALLAAQYSLIAASPTSPRVKSTGGEVPKIVLSKIAEQYLSSPNRVGPLLRQAKYAYGDGNVKIEILAPLEFRMIYLKEELGQMLSTVGNPFDADHLPSAVPARVRVTYRKHLGVPGIAAAFRVTTKSVRDMVGLNKDGFGQYFYEMTAEATVL